MRIAVAGFGIEGRASYAYYDRQGGHEITVVDERQVVDSLPEGVNTILGPGSFAELGNFDIVVRTPGINPRAISTRGLIWSATNEFFVRCPAPIIGVTGTKGKGTTCSLIAEMLRAAGHTVHLVGNIGIAALDCLDQIEPDHIVVFELSSFQLWDLKKGPTVAVVLHVEPDHLDVHTDMLEYVRAKANITLKQGRGGICFYHPTNPYSAQIAGVHRGASPAAGEARNSDSTAVRYGVEHGEGSALPSVHLSNENFVVRRTGAQEPAVHIPATTLQIPGAHNQQNACAAISAALVFGVCDNAIVSGLTGFSGLKHRLKYVGEVNGTKYYDDSVSTTPGSAIAAIRSFVEPKVMILGGSAKGASFEELAEVAANSNVRAVVAIGVEADRIELAMNTARVAIVNLGVSSSMDEIVNTAQRLTAPNDIVVLSPACASFDMFTNYAERGDKFIEAVDSLSAEHAEK
ncbi:UDP-N-acetylmuramoyl-L-alanine--D-glutamate ligase [Nocardia niigatensis]